MELSPDLFHKANVSGGLPYAIELPNHSVDAPFLDEWHKTTFIDYLRITFQWGGFPGLKKSTYSPKEFLAVMTDDLAPLRKGGRSGGDGKKLGIFACAMEDFDFKAIMLTRRIFFK